MNRRRGIPKALVVQHEAFGFTRHGIRWRLTLACGHVREVTDGTKCRPDARGSWRVGNNWYQPPKTLACIERIGDRLCSGAQLCGECVFGRRRPAVRDGLCALHATKASARKAASAS